MRCKPATRYLIQTSNIHSDTLIYELRLQNTTNITQQILLEIPIQLIDRISVQQLGDNDNTILKEYVFTSKKLSQRIYYDRNVMFPFDLLQGARYNVLLCRVDRTGEGFRPIRPPACTGCRQAVSIIS